MKKLLFVVFFVLMTSLLAACSSKPEPAPVNSNATSIAATVQALVPATPTRDVVADSVKATIVAMTPSAVTEEVMEQTETPAPTATGTPLPTKTLVPVGLQLRTASDIRAFGRVIGWVTGGANGDFVQGAQIALKSDFTLKTLPEGEVLEFECVQYIVMNGEVHAKPVCDGAIIRFNTTSVVPEGSIGTLWLTHPVVGSEIEQWAEGFINEPCICSDGDCRDQ